MYARSPDALISRGKDEAVASCSIESFLSEASRPRKSKPPPADDGSCAGGLEATIMTARPTFLRRWQFGPML